MPRRKSKRTGGKSRRRGRPSGAPNTGPPSSAVIYRGPTRPRNEATGTQVSLFRLSNAISIATSAGGSFGQYFANDPSGIAEWSNFTAVFQEFRCISVMARFIPKYQFVTDLTTSLVSTGEIVWYNIRSPAAVTPATTLALAYEYAGARAVYAGRPSTHSCKMNGVETANWLPVSAPAKLYGIVLTMFDAPVSMTIGTVTLDYLVQFRARQ